mgnify:CR=1 FL=1
MAKDQIQEIKQKTDIVDFISHYINLEKAGKNYKALCPFHEEKTPSFMVSPDLQIYKCFGCGKSGDIYNFLMEMEGLEFGEALQNLAEKTGVKLERSPAPKDKGRKEKLYEINHLAREYFHFLLTKHDVGKQALEYVLEKRELPMEAVEEFKLGYAPDSWESLGKFLLSKNYTLSEIIETGLVVPKDTGRKFYDRFRGRVVFPLHDERGRVVGFSGRLIKDEEGPKYMNSPESPVFNKRRHLYGLFKSKEYIRKSRKAVVVEGHVDFLTPYSRGTKNIVASEGTALTPGQIKLLSRYADEISLCFDTDLAGSKATKRGIEAAEKTGLDVNVIVLPAKYKDPDDAARDNVDAWEEAVSSKIPIYDYYLQIALEKYDEYSPEGKKKIAAEVLPEFKRIPDDIQRAAYLQKLSSALDMEMAVIKSALKKIRVEESSEYENKSTKDLETYFEQRKYPLREFYMLALIIRAPKDRAEAYTHRLGKDDFSHPLLRELFEELKRYHQSTESFVLNEFRDTIRERRDILELLEDLALQDFNFVLDVLDDELEVCLHKLKSEKTRRRIRKLSKEIANAEKEGDQDKVVELQKQLKKYSKKLQ